MKESYQPLYKWSALPSPYATLPLKAEREGIEFGYRCQSPLKFSKVTATSLTQTTDPTLCLTHRILVKKKITSDLERTF